ncbi:serine hydrolase [Metabacillus fastidiosus]|uniref:serine hydrolase domain-containing protein n=1 Tax=Metabacillus fastidiosus TaxID=1458 RepID=UPI002DBD2F6F|nr:serine hydrolase [Metabacillus fastidiosus]MEC2077558.1 serine hydrolase [Metabacillus fastidiosus]
MDKPVRKKLVPIVLSMIVLVSTFFSWSVTSLAVEETSSKAILDSELGEKTPSGIPISELEGFVDNYVKDYIGKTTSGAAIVVLKDNQIVLSKGYGDANIEKDIPIDPRKTVFEWGSITKLFVWTSVMQLVEQGKIDLNEDIRTYLPEGFLTKLKYDSPITMLDLMHHTAGFEDYIFDLGYSSPDKVKSLEEGLKLAEPVQVYKPGEVVAYSNFSTSLAAYIVELLTGQEFYQYASEHIFSKIDSKNASIHPTLSDNKKLLENKATGYKLNGPSKFIESNDFYVSMYPSGAINGTAEDLAKFASALMLKEEDSSPLFQKKETLDGFLTQSYSADENIPGNAHGFWEYEGRKRGITHGGNTEAFSSNLHIVPEENFAVIILTNQSGEMDICYGLTKELVGEESVSVAASNENMPDASELEGTYTSARRAYHGFLNIYYELIPLKITAVNDREIQLGMSGLSANYIQTSPYMYKKIKGHKLFDVMGPMYFHVENGKVTQISASISDYLPVSTGKSLPFLILYLILAVLSIGYFIISPLILLFRGISRRRKKHPVSPLQRWNSILILTGTATVINNFILIARMLIDSFRAYSEIIVHIIINYGLTALGVVSFIFMLAKGRKTKLTKLQKFYYGLSVIMFFILVFLMIVWQFYR